jgi:hypothetical protein
VDGLIECVEVKQGALGYGDSHARLRVAAEAVDSYRQPLNAATKKQKRYAREADSSIVHQKSREKGYRQVAMDGVLSETGKWRAELGMGAIPRNAMPRLRPARHRLKLTEIGGRPPKTTWTATARDPEDPL